MAVWILGIDWWRSELLKIALKGQEVLCLTENFYPPDASLRRKLHHLTSLCLMMLFCCFYRAAVSENNPWASPNIKSGKGLFSDQQVISVTLALPFFFFFNYKKKKNHFISLELCTFISVRLCGVQSHVLRGPRHPGTPFWVVRRRGTRSRSRLPSWRRRNGWLGDRAPASRSSGLSTGTPQEPRFHRAERDSAQSAETQHNPLFMTSNYQRWVSPEIPLLLEDHIKYALRSNPPDFH